MSDADTTAADQPEIGLGDVEIELTGEKMSLKPSLEACTKISRMNGGIVNTISKLSAYDFDTIVSVVSLGLGTTAKELPDRIYRTGLTKLTSPCIRFCTIISNGGRPPSEDDQGNAGAAGAS